MKQQLLALGVLVVAACGGAADTSETTGTPADDGGTSSGSSGSSSGSSGSSGSSDGGSIYDTPTTCTSNKTWTGGDRGSASMHPGKACITCHATQRDAPTFGIAGTVYPSAHEPDDCNGVAGNVTVVVTDANGKETRLAVNAVGNFSTRSTIAAPFHVKVVSGTKERSMNMAPPTGDCNSCHTVDGTKDAPGRIMAP